MAIRRRTPVQTKPEQKHRLRHPLLKHGATTTLIYNFIKQNPGSKRRDFMHLSTSGQPLTNLVKEGLVRVTGGKRGSYTYEVVPENEIGPGRDVLDVEITVFVNSFGEYSINARMIGQHLTAHEDFPRELLRQTTKIHVPSPDEPYAARPMVDVNELQTFAKPKAADFLAPKRDLIIDADYTILPKK